ncbi:MAG: DNA replication and repair protein RecF [Gemmatimonadetes bacterium]|nr:DNA replication and repair protein RecF [Gemmatimonadota bacterium]
MVLKQLVVHHFRNLGKQELEFPGLGVAIVGENAQGKTNLLESIYYLEVFRSFRGASDEQLVAFGEEVFRVSGSVATDSSRGGATEVAAAYDRRARRKKVSVNGELAPRIGDALGHLGAVFFSPGDVGVVSDGPAARRRFLDIALSLQARAYLRALVQYRQTLSQRNAALRDGAGPAAVGAWDDGFVRAGAQVVEARRAWISRWSSAFAEYYEAISGGAPAAMSYAPGFVLDGAVGEAEVGEVLRRALAATAPRERRAGTTVSGPHRDDVELTMDGPRGGTLEMRVYASAGQRRTAALALRLVEAACIRERRGGEPVLLLDDVFAELDAGRSERVLELLDRDETGQVILTAPKASDVRLRADTLARWSIRDGRVAGA